MAVENNPNESVESADSRNLFVDSLSEITPDELGKKREDPNKRQKCIFSAIRILLMVIFGSVFVVSVLLIINNFRGYNQGKEIYSQISENMFENFLGGNGGVSPSIQLKRAPAMLDYDSGLTALPDESDSVVISESGMRFEMMKSNLRYLSAINPDIYGYINIEGTKISYPIVKGTDNDYYLNRAWNREYLVVGSIFADYRATRVLSDKRNTVFYGHNMNDGSMFNNVMEFLKPEVFNSTLIEIYTEDAVYIYKPFSVYKTVHTDQYFRMDYADDADFLAFCANAKGKSEVENDIEINAGDTIITLSTCTSDDDVEFAFRGRYALHAKLIRVER